MPEKILFVINPGSGAKNFDWTAHINEYFKDKDIITEFYILQMPVNCDELGDAIKNSSAGKVVAIGGDGTINLVARYLMGTKRPLGIIPGGSANGMAKELMIPNKPDKALEIIENGQITPVDTILLNKKHLCIHLSDIGLNAQLIKNFDEGNQRGKLGYAKVFFKTLAGSELMKVHLTNKEKTIVKAAIMIVIANAGKYGTGAVINPLGTIHDTLFEVIIVKRVTIGSLIRMMFSKQFKPKNIETYQCKNISIASKKNLHFQVDGEYMGKIKKVDAAIQPLNLHLILPEVYVKGQS